MRACRDANQGACGGGDCRCDSQQHCAGSDCSGFTDQHQYAVYPGDDHAGSYSERYANSTAYLHASSDKYSPPYPNF